VAVWDAKSGRSLATHATLGRSSNRLFFLPGTTVVALCNHDSIRFWDFESNQEPPALTIASAAASFSPDGRMVAVTGGYPSPAARVVETATGIDVWKDTTGAAGQSIAFAPNGRMVAIGAGDGTVRLIDWPGGKECLSFKGAKRGPYHLVFSPDGTRLAGVEYATALVWDLTDVMKPALPGKGKIEERELDTLLAQTGSTDGATAYQAVWQLVGADGQVLPKLKTALTRSAAPSPKQLARWIRELDDDDFEVREAATKTLKATGADALGPVEAALRLKPTPEQQRRLEAILAALKTSGWTAERLREIRGVFLLEQIGSPEAREVLDVLAKQERSPTLAREAKSALLRLEQRKH
jgi:hypothetical protein